MPGATRMHCYLTDEEARRRDEAIALCDEVAEQYSLRSLAASLITFIGAIVAAAITSFA